MKRFLGKAFCWAIAMWLIVGCIREKPSGVPPVDWLYGFYLGQDGYAPCPWHEGAIRHGYQVGSNIFQQIEEPYIQAELLKQSALDNERASL